ncbi:MAG: hypothetical protein ACR5LD_03095 [Symbiopectobacterium sp.]
MIPYTTGSRRFATNCYAAEESAHFITQHGSSLVKLKALVAVLQSDP